MQKLALLVLLLVAFAATSAHADVILYQTGFDTDTTDVPGTYAPFAFSPDGADVTAIVDSGIVRIARSSSGAGSTVPFALSELTLSSQDLLATSAFPSVFSVSVEIGGTPGNESWWGPDITFDDGIHNNIHYGFHPGWSINNFRVCKQTVECFDTSATSSLFPSLNVLYPVDITVTKLLDSYLFDIDLTDPGTSQVYSDSIVVPYEWDINTIGFARQGHGGGDVLFDNLTISTPVPEPSTALLLATGILGLAARRRAPRRGDRGSMS